MMERDGGTTGSSSEPGRDAPPPGPSVPAALVAPFDIPAALDPLGVTKAAMAVWQSMASQPGSMFQAQTEFASAWLGIASRAASPTDEAPPAVVAPAKGDGRWKHEAWQNNPTFDALKQGYLLATNAVLEGIERSEVDAETKSRVKFFAKQFCDAMSPTNFPFLNPAVIEETMKTGGQNLQRGARNVMEDARDNNGRPALVDKKAFTVGVNVAASKGSVVYRNELIELIQYAPTTETVHARPLVIVPPWINKFYILDLQPANSLIKYATDHGIQTFVVSWRNPDASLGHLGWEDYLELGPIAAAKATREITGSADVNQIGYCIGGTLTAMELAYLAKTDPTLVNAVTFFAAMVDFTDVGDLRNFMGPEALAALDKKLAATGVLEASDMADTFNMLRSNDLIWNVAVNRYLLGKDAPAFDLLYWNSDATRLPAKMHSYYMKNMYVQNLLSEPGALRFRDVPIDLRSVRNDIYSVASIEDHIAPWRTVYRMTQLFSGDVKFRLGHSGHIAGIINAPANNKGSHWVNDTNPASPDAWFEGAQKKNGSWWPDWIAWLTARSGEMVPAPAQLGSDRHPASAAAPGEYVLEMA